MAGVPRDCPDCPHHRDTLPRIPTTEIKRLCARLSGDFAPDPTGFSLSALTVPRQRLRSGLTSPSVGLRIRLAKAVGSGADGLGRRRTAPAGSSGRAKPAPTTSR